MNSRQPQTKTRQFRTLLQSEQLEFICEAHNGLSAKIVEEAGFAGIWASGLSISAQFGVRDNNEASWTQVLEDLEFMSDATKVPILLERYGVRQFQQHAAAHPETGTAQHCRSVH